MAAAPRLVDQDVERAVHRFDVVLLATVEFHRGVHPLGVELEVAAGLPQVGLGNVWRHDVVVSVSEVRSAAVVLDLLAQQPALRMPDRQTAPQIRGEGVEVEFGAEFPVVPLLGFFEPVEVGAQCLAIFPCGPVDPLELRILLVAPPVGAGGPHQLDGFDPAGRRDVRTTAQVDEILVAVQRHGAGPGPFGFVDTPDDLRLVRLVGEDAQRLVDRDGGTLERLVFFDDLVHPGLDPFEVLGGERSIDVEVVVEPVGDRRPDRELGSRIQVEHGLRHDVGARVAQNVPSRLRVLGDHGERSAAIDRPFEVEHVPVHRDGNRGTGEAGADARRHVESRRSVLVLPGRTVGEGQFNRHSARSQIGNRQGYRFPVLNEPSPPDGDPRRRFGNTTRFRALGI